MAVAGRLDADNCFLRQRNAAAVTSHTAGRLCWSGVPPRGIRRFAGVRRKNRLPSAAPDCETADDWRKLMFQNAGLPPAKRGKAGVHPGVAWRSRVISATSPHPKTAIRNPPDIHTRSKQFLVNPRNFEPESFVIPAGYHSGRSYE